jgi:hypothetical protein
MQVSLVFVDAFAFKRVVPFASWLLMGVLTYIHGTYLGIFFSLGRSYGVTFFYISGMYSKYQILDIWAKNNYSSPIFCDLPLLSSLPRRKVLKAA